MKNPLFLLFCICFLSTPLLKAQKGLENIRVEKFYISSAQDTVGSNEYGYLPIGSTTYRIYADLAPVYRFQAIYGDVNHELRIATTTRFFNCAMQSGTSSMDIEPLYLKDGSLILDSWISVGAAALDYQAVMKTMDDTLPSLALNNVIRLFQNEDPAMGIPLTKSDGMKKLRLQPSPAFFNFKNELKYFDYMYRDSVNGILSTHDGAWASYGGTVGPHPENQVLLGQFTTDGVFSFELNMQVAIPGGGAERYVSKNAVDSEFVFPALIYTNSPENKAPAVQIELKSAKNKSKAGNDLQFMATASDPDGSIAYVDFYVDNRFVYSSNKFPYVFNMKEDGLPHVISVTAVDNDTAKTRSENIFIAGSGL